MGGSIVRWCAFVAASGVLATACGNGDGQGDVSIDGEADSSESQARFPDDFGLAQVIAGDDEGWLLGREDPDGVGRHVLWRWAPGEQADRLGEVPDGVGADGVGFGGGVALAGVTCADEDAPEDDSDYACETVQALVVMIDEAGETVASSTLWEKEELNLEDAPGLAFVGTTSSSLWISTDRTLFEVDAEGTVRQSVPSSGGLECVVDEELVAFVDVDHEQQIEGGSAGPSGSNVNSAVPASNRLIEVRKPDGSGWSGAEGETIEIDPIDGVRCSSTGADVFTYDDHGIVATWSPTDGWTESETPDEAPSDVLATDSSDSGTSFFQVSDGSILESTINGFVQTPLSLPTPSDAEVGPTTLTVDASDSIIVGCARQLTGLTDAEASDTGSTRPAIGCAVTGR